MLVSFDDAEHFEDISKTFDKKLETLQAHASQVPDGFDEFIKKRGRALGKKIHTQYAEGFKKVELS